MRESELSDSEALVLAIAGHIDGWKSATFAWTGDPDPAVEKRNKAAAIQAHAAECIRRIRASLAAGKGEADTARLDWLQAHQETVYRCTHQERRPTTETFRHYETVQVFDGWAVLHDHEPKATVREAIDYAMGSSAPSDKANSPNAHLALSTVEGTEHRDGGEHDEQAGSARMEAYREGYKHGMEDERSKWTGVAPTAGVKACGEGQQRE